MSSALELNGFGIQAGPRVIFADVSLVVPDRGVVVLMGPGGSGKSTLLRVITEHASHPAFVRTGEALLSGAPVSAEACGELVRQRIESAAQSVIEVFAQALPNRSELTKLDQREVVTEHIVALQCDWLADRFDEELCALPAHEQRVTRIIAATLSNPTLICVDEATAELEAEPAAMVLDVLERVANDRAVLFVTHNQVHARQIADYAGLLAAGQLVEFGPAMQFFDNPVSAVTRQYLRTGGCSLPSLNATQEDLDESYRETRAYVVGLDEETTASEHRTEEAIELSRLVPRKVVPGSSGPRGFRWLVPGRLGGTPYPGIVSSTQHDLEALQRVGVTHLITLTEEPANFTELASRLGIQVRFFPIDDMGAPAMAEAEEICAEVEALAESHAIIAYHCKAGLGRTGTMLAAQLIYEGASASDALHDVRSAHSKWVQSRVQEQFLEQFARFVSGTDRNQAPPTQTKKGA